MKKMLTFAFLLIGTLTLSSFSPIGVKPIPIEKGSPAEVVNDFYTCLVEGRVSKLANFAYVGADLQTASHKKDKDAVKNLGEMLKRRYSGARAVKFYMLKDETVKNSNALVQVNVKYADGTLGQEEHVLRLDENNEWKICFDPSIRFDPNAPVPNATTTERTRYIIEDRFSPR